MGTCIYAVVVGSLLRAAGHGNDEAKAKPINPATTVYLRLQLPITMIGTPQNAVSFCTTDYV
jgi:hypothetical protein